MFKWLLPKEVNFFEDFEKHAMLIVEASQLFYKLTNDGNDISAITNQIKQLEHQADQIAHQCIEKLHKTFITPFERNDIHRLITRMDDIIDCTQHAASFIKIYKLSIITTDFEKLAKVLMQASQELLKLIQAFSNFKNLQLIQASFIEINHLENIGDQLYLKGIADLFENEQDTRLILKWKEVYENIENGLDRCEDVANIIEGIILESS